MTRFGSIAEFAAYMATRIEAVEQGKAHGLDVAGRIVAAEAKNEIGIPQSEAGPFAAWDALADSTVEEKTKLGYVGQRSAEDPLLRTGELRDSIGHSVEGSASVMVGSTSEIAVYQELGTTHIPPRSFLGGAMVRKGEDAAKAIAGEVLTSLTGQRRNSWV